MLVNTNAEMETETVGKKHMGTYDVFLSKQEVDERAVE